MAAQQSQIDDLDNAVELQQAIIDILTKRVASLTKQVDALARR
jgi:uncharacterized coiled-coil protein SlyX